MRRGMPPRTTHEAKGGRRTSLWEVRSGTSALSFTTSFPLAPLRGDVENLQTHVTTNRQTGNGKAAKFHP